MSNNSAPIPRSASYFASKIVENCRLDKASQIGLIEQVILEAVREAANTEYLREMIGCSQCEVIMARYSAIKQEFGHACPQCQHPMASLEVLRLKKIGELQERVTRLEAERDGKLPG